MREREREIKRMCEKEKDYTKHQTNKMNASLSNGKEMQKKL